MEGVEYNYRMPLRRLRRFLWSERKIIYLIFAYAIINGIIILTLPLGIQAILNYILGGRVTSSWVILIIIVITGLTVSGIIQIAQLTLTERLQQRIFTKSSFEIAVRLPKIKVEALQNHYAPEMMNRFFDTVMLQKGVSKLLIDFPTAALQVIFGLALISVYHAFFLFFSLGVVVLIYILFKYTGPPGVVTSLKESTKKYEVAHWLEEVARTIGTFKLAGKTILPLQRVDKLLMGYLHFRRKHFGILINQFKIMVAFKVITIGVLLVLGSLLLIEDEISLGQFVAAEIIIILIMNSIEKIIVGLETVYDVLTSAEKLGSITDMDLETEDVKKYVSPQGEGGFVIAVENLSFIYPGTERKILDRISFKLASGEKVALLGTEGAGKSTVLQMLAGLYEQYDGRITFNGIPLTAMRIDILRSEIGDNIGQETIFSGTVRENITLGNADISDAMIKDAFEVVGANEGLNKMQDGLNTPLLPEGMRLPRTLVKKFILARSIVNRPKLLLLEMADTHLRKSERAKFYDHLFSAPWSVVALTKDEYYLERCSKIIFMDAGEIRFVGDYQSFKESNYAQLIG